MNSPDQISHEELAGGFGLEEIRVGRHYLRKYPKHGERIGSLWIKYFWILEIKPNFDRPSILCAIEAQGEEFEKKQTPGWIKAAYANSAKTTVVELQADPVSNVLHEFDLLPGSGGLCLDCWRRSNSAQRRRQESFQKKKERQSSSTAFPFLSFDSSCCPAN